MKTTTLLPISDHNDVHEAVKRGMAPVFYYVSSGISVMPLQNLYYKVGIFRK